MEEKNTEVEESDAKLSSIRTNDLLTTFQAEVLQHEKDQTAFCRNLTIRITSSFTPINRQPPAPHIKIALLRRCLEDDTTQPTFIRKELEPIVYAMGT